MKKKLLLSSALGMLIAVGIWIFALTSDEYRVSKQVLTSDSLVQQSGRVEHYFVTGFRISYGEGRTSGVSMYVIGEKKRGWLRVVLAREPSGPKVVSVVFEGQPISTR